MLGPDGKCAAGGPEDGGSGTLYAYCEIKPDGVATRRSLRPPDAVGL